MRRYPHELRLGFARGIRPGQLRRGEARYRRSLGDGRARGRTLWRPVQRRVAGGARPALAELPSGAAQPEPASGTFDLWDAANVSPVVAWLATEGCAETSQVYHVYGSELFVLRIPEVVQRLSTQGRWTIEACAREVPPHAAEPVADKAFFPGVP